MKFLKHTLPFLVLNMLISAATLVAVFYFFGPKLLALAESRRAASNREISANTDPKQELPAQSSAQQLNLLIGGVFGAGDLQTEYVLLKNQGKATAELLNWTLKGSRGQTYQFPDLRLAQNGTVKIFSREGTDSVLELFLNSSVPLWQAGDILTLKDADGKIQTSFQVP